ncbi:prepilin peptidase [Aliivibrio wodanis]|uniref:prepilin peptidase n=1 Tax=Aliivibrio wodanis TaxID=80852 RepID=UPI00406C20F9
MELIIAFNLSIWSILFMVGVKDAEKHRIPNKLLFILIFLIVIEWAVINPSLVILQEKLLGGVVMFAIGLLLFFLKAMAPGDVKLLAVVGFLVGLPQLQSVGYWVIISAGIVGVFYAFYYSIESPQFGNRVKKNTNKLTIQQEALMLATRNTVMKKTVMPFAPAVVIGLALHQYFL